MFPDEISTSRNKVKKYNAFLYSLSERTVCVLAELKWCGDYLADESIALNHLHLLFEEGTREKMQVMEFQFENRKHTQ